MQYWFYADVKKTDGLTIPILEGDHISKGDTPTSGTAAFLDVVPDQARIMVVLPTAKTRIRNGEVAQANDTPYLADIKDYIGVMPGDILSAIEG